MVELIYMLILVVYEPVKANPGGSSLNGDTRLNDKIKTSNGIYAVKSNTIGMLYPRTGTIYVAYCVVNAEI